jgi:His-Xaa-Ser system protein HxsD
MESEGRVVEFSIAQSLFDRSAVLKTSYRFGDRFDLKLQIDEETGILKVSASLRGHIRDAGVLGRFESEFMRELIDQQLREEVRTETEAVRNLILAHTFSRTGHVTGE